MTIDILAFGAHPDDVELSIGGTIAKMVDRGRSVVIVDLTRGEMGTRGTPEIRAEEANAAAEVLGVTERINLDMGDGVLMDSLENRKLLIEVIRKYRPSLVLGQHWEDLHADHAAAGDLLKAVMYSTGFANYPADGPAYRPNEYLFYMAHFPFEPNFIVDITDYWELKVKAMACYESQLHSPSSDAPKTLISQPDFMDKLESRARHFGSQIHCSFGEPFSTRRAVPMDDPVEHYRPFRKI